MLKTTRIFSERRVECCLPLSSVSILRLVCVWTLSASRGVRLYPDVPGGDTSSPEQAKQECCLHRPALNAAWLHGLGLAGPAPAWLGAAPQCACSSRGRCALCGRARGARPWPRPAPPHTPQSNPDLGPNESRAVKIREKSNLETEQLGIANGSKQFSRNSEGGVQDGLYFSLYFH